MRLPGRLRLDRENQGSGTFARALIKTGQIGPLAVGSEQRFRVAVSMCAPGAECQPPPSAQDGPVGHEAITAPFKGSSQNKAGVPLSPWSQRLGGAEEW